MSQPQSTYETHLLQNNPICTRNLRRDQVNSSTDVDIGVATGETVLVLEQPSSCSSGTADDSGCRKIHGEEEIEYACCDDDDNVPKTLDWDIKSQLVNSHIDFPNCSYLEHSRRSVDKRVKHLSLDEYLSCLDDFSNHSVICIDGVNGSGKSTLANKTNRKYLKTNMFCPDVTNGSDYNFYVFNFLEYLMVQVMYPVPESVESAIWDRDRYANLRFYCVHYLMYEFRNTVMSVENSEPVYEKLNTLASATHMFNILEYLENVNPSPKTAIFVYSDMITLSHVLVKRGGMTGTFNAKEINYQVGQYHVYRYFAKVLNHPLIDIPFMFKTYEIDINRIQFEILKRINFGKTTISDEEIAVNANIITPVKRPNDSIDRTSAIRLHNFCKSWDDQAVYNYSLK